MRCIAPVVCCAILLVLSGCIAGDRSDLTPVAVTAGPDIEPLSRAGQVYFGGQPSDSALEQAADAGIRTVVNLRTAEEIESLAFDERQTVLDLGMMYVHLPIEGSTLSRTDALSLAHVLDTSPAPVLMHCGSSNRVGGLWALYLNQRYHVPIATAVKQGEAAGLKNPKLIQRVEAAARP